MSREIKFTVWDKEEQRLSKPFHFWQGSIEWEKDVPMPMSFARANYERFEWLQYTGRKDRNGKEIYDGYIARVNIEDFKDDRPDSPFHGIYCLDEVVEWHSEGGYWDLTGNVAPLMAFTKEQIVIVGSIYENPELLKEPANVQ